MLQEVSVAVLGKGVSPRSPVTQKPTGAKIPVAKVTKTVRLTVFQKYASEKLDTRYADALLKQIWPPQDRTACSFASWRSEKSKDEVVALVSYVTCAQTTAEALLRASGQSALFVSQLSKDKKPTEGNNALHPFWVPRPADTSDQEYRKIALDELKTSGQNTGLIHRLGGGRDLGFQRSGLDVCKTAPFLWLASCPVSWSAEDLSTFLLSVAWGQPEILGQSGRGWRFRAAHRPLKETTYIYDVGEGGVLKIVPQPRKCDVQCEQSKPLGRPKVPWVSPVQSDESEAQQPDEVVEVSTSAPNNQRTTRPPAQGQPPSKKQRSSETFGSEEEITDPSCPLVGWKVVEAGGEGACGYKALAAALYFAGKYDIRLDEDSVTKDARSLRVKAVQHLSKEARKFQSSWGADPLALEHTGKTWEEYLEKAAESTFLIDELQVKAAAEKMKRRVVIHYLDSSKHWARRVFNAKADGEPLVLLLREQHYRPVRPIGKGFPQEWCRNVGAQAPHKARGAGREASNKLTSGNLLKLPSSSCASSRATSVSTFKVGAKSAQGSHVSCSTFRVGATPKSARGTKVPKASKAFEMPGPQSAVASSSSSSRPASESTLHALGARNASWANGAFTCVCGWQLSACTELLPKREQNNRFYEARKHWSSCQPGFPFPKLAPAQRAQKYMYVANRASEGRKRKAWTQWCNLRTIVSSKVLANLHELKDVPVKEPPRGTPAKFECIRCGGCYDLSHSRRMACQATPDHLKMRGRLVEIAVRQAEGCRTKRAVKITRCTDPRASSRMPMKGMSAKRRRAADKQTLTRHVQVSKKHKQG